MKKTLNEIGIKYGIFGIVLILADVVSLIISKTLPEFNGRLGLYKSVITTVLSIYCIGFPLLYLLTKNLPDKQIEKKKLSFKKFLYYVLLMFGCMFVGNMVGMPIHLILSLPSKMKGMRGLLGIIYGINPIVSILVVAVCAPIFEELICRKILVSKLAVHNEYLAIIASGLVFGLLHGNFQQGAFAFFIGCLFAYVYLNTGKVKYTMFLHAVLNGTNSLITTPLLKNVIKSLKGIALPSDGSIMDMFESLMIISDSVIVKAAPWIIAFEVWSYILGAVMIAGTVFLIIARAKKKIALTPEEREKVGSKKMNIKALLTSPGMWLFYATMLVSFVETYIVSIFV